MDPHAGQSSTRTAGFLVLLLTLFVPGLATAQGITVSLDRKVPEPVPPRTRIELVVEPQVPASQGRILVLLGKNDVTDLFEPVGNRYRYRGDLFPLPPGPSEISVSLVGRDGRVTPLGRFTLQVASPAAVTPPPPPPPTAAAEPAPVTEAAPEAPAGAPLTFTLDTGGKPFVPRDAPLLLRASRPLTDADGRLVILIGSMDVSELFARTPAGLSLTKSPVKLPSGSSEVVIFQISDAGESTELSRFPLNVLTSAGLETFELQPRLDLTLAGALGTRDSPAPEVENPRERFQDFTGQLSVQGRLTKQGWTVTSALQATAVSNRQQAIRFGQLGGEAPKVDLASYTVQAQKGATSFTAGTTAFGQDKYLVNQFASRGLVATTGFGGIVDVTGAALSSVNLVGYDNLLGISQRNDRIFAGRLGLELMPKTPGALRFEATVMDGSRTPQDRFQQGVVDDAEENRGVGLRALASLVDGRIRFEGGFARSRFANPPDPTLNPDGEVVAVQASTKDAYFGVLTADVFREIVLGETARGSVNVVLRHDRVDPLFRSLGATNQSDLEQTGVEINTILGPAAIQLGAQTQRDNLDDLAALLTTRSHRQNATATLPVGALFPGKEGPSPFLPQIVYTLQRAEQKGSVNLETGEFTETFVPNQVSTTHAATVDWTVGVFRLGYRLTVGVIDNRQEDRAAADSNVTGHALQAGANPLPTLQLAAEVGTERQRNDDPFTVLTTNRVAAQATWGFTTLTTLAANLNLTDGEDDTGQTGNTSLTADASLTFRLSKTSKDQKHGVSAQAFLRYGFTESKSRSPFSPDEVVRKQWILSSGLTLSLF